MPGDFEKLVVRVREHYLEQFWAFIEQEKQGCTAGASELKIEINGEPDVYKKAYCIDFACNDGEVRLIELVPERVLSFDPFAVHHGHLAIQVDYLRWDDIVIRHDLAEVPPAAVEGWFELWYGPDDRQTNMIHSLSIDPGEIDIDMGTAPPEALYDMLELLERAGARRVQLTASRAEAED
jgi:hypothetical protein